MRSVRRILAPVLACIAILGLSTVAHGQEEISRIAGLSAWYRADNVARAADGTLTALNDDAQGRARPARWRQAAGMAVAYAAKASADVHQVVTAHLRARLRAEGGYLP